MKIYELNKNDIVMVNLEQDYFTMDAHRSMQEHYEKLFPNNKVLILDDRDIKISIIKQGK